MESEKGWSRSTKLHVALGSAIVIVGMYLDNRHNITIADHVISCAELALTVALGGRISMGVVESIMGGASEINQKFDPKDIDGLPE